MTFKIFISYSQGDFLERGRIVYNYLSTMFPEDDVFIDQSKPKAKKWREENDKKLKESNLVVLIITPAAIHSDEVAREIKISNELKKLILPCKIQDLKMDWKQLPLDLGSIDGITFKNDEDLRTSLFGAVTEIRTEYLSELRNSSRLVSDYISVFTDKKKYSDGEEIKISGRVKELLSNISISLQIIDPFENLVTAEQIDVDSKKYFFSELKAGGILWKATGTYTIKVLYGSSIRTSQTTFDFVGSSGISKSTTSKNMVTVEGSSHSINYQIKGGNVISVVRDVGTSSLLINIESSERGELTITIPRDLIDARSDERDDDFFVLGDGEDVVFNENKTPSDRTLTIAFPKGTEEIEIIGISNPKRREIPLFKTPKIEEVGDQKIHTITLSTSVDRTVYPLDSKIYARANLNDIILNKLIIFEIYNSKNKLLLTKKINPLKHPDSNLKKAGIFETSFKMKGKDWRVNEPYILITKHGNAESQDSFVIDERMPVVQTDKSVYMWNSDLIVTVIDPDADKDSNKVEIVGNRKDSSLTISTSEGKIKNYKLRETGDSTGIFQGIIGLIGVYGSGKVSGYKIGKKNITKTQGKGIDDGFIKVKRGGEIKLIYKNRSQTATLLAFASDFGATIELDQKVYSWTDKVYLTIIAPDFNMDSNIVNIIGNKPENRIIISTSKGKISTYKLVETGKDTGIFVGEIQLTGFDETGKNKKMGITKGTGSKDGLVACQKEDILEVVLNYFGEEKVIGRALIKELSRF